MPSRRGRRTSRAARRALEGRREHEVDERPRAVLVSSAGCRTPASSTRRSSSRRRLRRRALERRAGEDDLGGRARGVGDDDRPAALAAGGAREALRVRSSQPSTTSTLFSRRSRQKSAQRSPNSATVARRKARPGVDVLDFDHEQVAVALRGQIGEPPRRRHPLPLEVRPVGSSRHTSPWSTGVSRCSSSRMNRSSTCSSCGDSYGSNSSSSPSARESRLLSAPKKTSPSGLLRGQERPVESGAGVAGLEDAECEARLLLERAQGGLRQANESCATSTTSRGASSPCRCAQAETASARSAARVARDRRRASIPSAGITQIRLSGRRRLRPPSQPGCSELPRSVAHTVPGRSARTTPRATRTRARVSANSFETPRRSAGPVSRRRARSGGRPWPRPLRRRRAAVARRARRASPRARARRGPRGRAQSPRSRRAFSTCA